MLYFQYMYIIEEVTLFMSTMSHFYISWKRQKTFALAI